MFLGIFEQFGLINLFVALSMLVAGGLLAFILVYIYFFYLREENKSLSFEIIKLKEEKNAAWLASWYKYWFSK